MKIPQWKRWLSYLFEMHIESAPSELNPHLYVSLKNGRLQLSTANAVYSYEDLYDNFTKTFAQFRSDYQTGEEVLILGFGLGSVPFIMEKMFKKTFQFTGIELDESVIYLANKYALENINSPIQLITANAFAYVFQTTQKYDVIVMDVFLDDVIPDDFETKDYLEALKLLLKPEGILLYNRLALTEEDLNKTTTFFENEFKSVFKNGIHLDVEGNWMLMNNAKPIAK